MQPNEINSPADLLKRVEGVQRVPTRDLELFIARNFLTPETCEELMLRIDRSRRPSDIANDIGIANYRTSETCDLDGGDPAVASIDASISSFLGLPPELGEPIQGQRYAPGQEFKLHTDTFEPGSPDFYIHTANAGQRTWTAMIYLNEPEEGGATRFKKIGKTFHPETGKMLIWNNLLADGRPNPATLHQGMKVRRGAKYVITKWFRQSPWAPPGM
jgi:prolyl 4-hydroxylase